LARRIHRSHLPYRRRGTLQPARRPHGGERRHPPLPGPRRPHAARRALLLPGRRGGLVPAPARGRPGDLVRSSARRARGRLLRHHRRPVGAFPRSGRAIVRPISMTPRIPALLLLLLGAAAHAGGAADLTLKISAPKATASPDHVKLTAVLTNASDHKVDVTPAMTVYLNEPGNCD